VNAGHRKGAVAYRVVGEGAGMQVRELPAFAAAALAGIGELPDTILDRAVIIRMRRRAPDEPVAPFRLRRVRPRAAALRDRMGAWAQAHAAELAEAEPAMPPGITDRPADVWEALLAVADVAGGQWPKRARAAAVALETVRAEATPSRGVQLLADIRGVFEVVDADRLSSEELCKRLGELEEAPWGDLRGHPIDARGLAGRLRPYGVRPHKVRTEESVLQGYLSADFLDAWRRYLPPVEAGTSGTDPTGGAETLTLTSDVPDVLEVPDVRGEEVLVPDTGPEQGHMMAEAVARIVEELDAEVVPATSGPDVQLYGVDAQRWIEKWNAGVPQ
jgi:hypothetical protein